MNNAKEFFQWLLNAVKIWVIVQPWEAGLRTRTGKYTKYLEPGCHFKIPYFDNVYVQEKRMRVADVPMQTCTTKDLQTITIKSALGYSIRDIKRLYDTLYHPETSLINIATGEIADLIFGNECKDIRPEEVEKAVLAKLNETDYGIEFNYFKITNFAVVKTFRLLQENSYSWEGLNMDTKK